MKGLEQLFDCFKLLQKRDRIIWIIALSLQVLLTILDLLGIAAIGLLSLIGIRGIQKVDLGNFANRTLEILGIAELEIQVQLSIIALAATILFISKTIVSAVISKKIISFFSRRAANMSSSIFSRAVKLPELMTQGDSNQKQIFRITQGVNSIVIGVLNYALNILSDAMLLIAILAFLFFVNANIAVLTMGIFGSLALLMIKVIGRETYDLGRRYSKLQIASSNVVNDVINLYKELYVRDKFTKFLDEFRTNRESMALVESRKRFIPFLGKYVIETALVSSIALVSALMFFSLNTSKAVALMGVFLASATRIAPAVLRIQQSAVSLRNHLGIALYTNQFLRSIELLEKKESESAKLNDNEKKFDRTKVIELTGVTFGYESSQSEIFKNLDLLVMSGEKILIRGESGLGKSTLIDLILGFLNPKSGEVRLFGRRPRQTMKENLARIAYVPQKPWIFEGTFRDNICLDGNYSDEEVFAVLNSVELSTLVYSSNDRLENVISYSGSSISGGQAQRISLARALLSNPDLLILDESTNSIDEETERKILTSIIADRPDLTLILVSHNSQNIEFFSRVLKVTRDDLNSGVNLEIVNEIN